MRIKLAALLLASILSGMLAAVSYSPGIHSTPGIWLAMANLPGLMVGMLAEILLHVNEEEPIFYILVGAANWAAYVLAIKAVLWVRRKHFA